MNAEEQPASRVNLETQIVVDILRIQSEYLGWSAEPNDGDFDTKIVEALMQVLDARARAYLPTVNRQDLMHAYIGLLRCVGSVLVQNAEHHVLKEPDSENHLGKMAESSMDLIRRTCMVPLEQREDEIRNALEGVGLGVPQEAEQWRTQIGIRIGTRFEARYRYWAAEAIEQVQRIAMRPQPAKATSDFKPAQPARSWEDIEISVLSDERVQIRVENQNETWNYAEMGFQDRRNGKPDEQWAVLLTLARNEGTMPGEEKSGKQWVAIEKRIERTRKALKKHFGMSDDPLPLIHGTGYRARFKISRAPAADR